MEVFMIFRILDIWHPNKEQRWVYSDDPCFKNKLSLFFAWIEQHQKDYTGLEIVEDNSTSPYLGNGIYYS
jgi:hypothetical protein